MSVPQPKSGVTWVVFWGYQRRPHSPTLILPFSRSRLPPLGDRAAALFSPSGDTLAYLSSHSATRFNSSTPTSVPSRLMAAAERKTMSKD